MISNSIDDSIPIMIDEMQQDNDRLFRAASSTGSITTTNPDNHNIISTAPFFQTIGSTTNNIVIRKKDNVW